MSDNKPSDDNPGGKDKPAASHTPKIPVKDPRQAHPVNKGFRGPGGHGFSPQGFSPRPGRARNMGRGR